VSLLKRVPLFERCSRRDLVKIGSLAREVEYPAGTPVVREGEPGSELFIIVDGEVDVRSRARKVATLPRRELFWRDRSHHRLAADGVGNNRYTCAGARDQGPRLPQAATGFAGDPIQGSPGGRQAARRAFLPSGAATHSATRLDGRREQGALRQRSTMTPEAEVRAADFRSSLTRQSTCRTHLPQACGPMPYGTKRLA
jgi:hypothetical protein